MPDIKPQIPMPLSFTEHHLRTVESWPERTSFGEKFLTEAHLSDAMVDGDTVTFTVANGTATYTLRRDLPRFGGAIIADLVGGDTPAQLKRSAAKFERKG